MIAITNPFVCKLELRSDDVRPIPTCTYLDSLSCHFPVDSVVIMDTDESKLP